MFRSHCITAVLLAALLGRGAAHAQTTVATFASLSGTAEVQRGARGEWQAALIGMPLFLGESVRTAPSGGATLVFTDDTVIALGPDTLMTVDRFPAGAKGPRSALLKLASGALEGLVGGTPDGEPRVEIETPSAVARASGTRCVVRYDAADKATDVASLDGTVSVLGRTGLIGPVVSVEPFQVSRVDTGKFPSQVKPLDDAARERLLAGITLTGTGERDGLDTDNPVLSGAAVAAEDRPDFATAAKTGSYLRPAVPGDPLIWRLSPDIRANTQPLPVYEAVPPNEVPPGAH